MFETFFQVPSEEEQKRNWERRMARHRQDPNCITHWLPRIQNAVPTPRTEIVPLELDFEKDRELWAVLDGKPLPGWWAEWIEQLRAAALRISPSGPWFLRTGVFSGKHDWSRCCAVTDLDRLTGHVLNLFEFSQIVDSAGLPYHIWAVREWLPGPVLTEYARYSGMPVRREFRAFAENGKVLCVHPYWPADALDETVTARPEFAAMNTLGEDEEVVRTLAAEASRHVEGAWSVDCLWTDRGWYVTDMAVAHQSYHWPDCEHAPRRS